VIGAAGRAGYDLLIGGSTPADVDASIEQLVLAIAKQNLPARTRVGRFGVDGRDATTLIAAAYATARDPRLPAGPTMEQLHRLVERIAGGDINVLILGETGVGKEVMAERVHRQSPRSALPFLGLNCAALSESLLETELFGHERGAFTGAVAAKAGLLETADGGTVFLDEIGDLPPAIQVKLLRVIEERRMRRVGAVKARVIDVRFIAATNRDLASEVGLGRFREDLYYRLNGISLTIPPLRARVNELPALTRELVGAACKRAGRPPVQLAPDTMAALLAHPWPGNIRELRNVLERAVLLAGDGPVQPFHLTLEGRPPRGRADEPEVAATSLADLDQAAAQLRRELEDVERRRIIAALAECAGNQSRAAELLNMPRRTLVAKLAQLDIPRPNRGSRRS
jgi:DNA-binding NtrC family response regulator